MAKREQAKKIFLRAFGDYQILGSAMENVLSLEEMFDGVWEILDYGGLIGTNEEKKEQIFDLIAQAVTAEPQALSPDEARQRLELILNPDWEPSVPQ